MSLFGKKTNECFRGLRFEEVRTDMRGRTIYRSKVPGGWILASAAHNETPCTLTFYPDPNHEWDGGSLG